MSKTTISEFDVKGFKTTIVHKPDFCVVGYTRPVNLDGSSIGQFIKELTEKGQISKLLESSQEPQQVWVCLSDVNCADSSTICEVCDLSCTGFDTRCTVCVEKTVNHDLSEFNEGELFMLSIPASRWAVFEVNEEQNSADLHRFDVYMMVGEIGYKFNEKIRLHFDNEHEWEPGKRMHFLLPVIPV